MTWGITKKGRRPPYFQANTRTNCSATPDTILQGITKKVERKNEIKRKNERKNNTLQFINFGACCQMRSTLCKSVFGHSAFIKPRFVDKRNNQNSTNLLRNISG